MMRAFARILFMATATVAVPHVVGQPTSTDSQTAPAPLTEITQIRKLSRAEAARAIPVRLRGTVIWQDVSTHPAFFIHDNGFNIWIDSIARHPERTELETSSYVSDTTVGSLVEVEGVTDPGGYAPCVIPHRVTKLGSGTQPSVRTAPIERFLSGAEDGQWIEVEGVVQQVSPPDTFGDSRINMMVDGHPCLISSEYGRNLDPDALVDARIRLRGILTPLPNLRSEAIGLRMNIMGPEWIEIITPPPPDPFLASRVELDRLLPFDAENRPYHRKVTSGVVTLTSPGDFFFLQKGERAVRVQSDATDLMPGDSVDVAGFIDTSQTIASLTSALVRKLHHTGLPQPVSVTTDHILNPTFRSQVEKVTPSDYHGRLITLTGQVVSTQADPSVLLVVSDGHVFPVRTIRASWQDDPDCVEGAVLKLTGVAELEFKEDSSTQGSFSIAGMGLWVDSPNAVTVVSKPSWWTPQRLAIALGGTGVILALATIWNLALRRLLHKRSLLLEEVMRKHRDSELEFRGASQERRRLAGDLHDGLQQLMAGAAYRMEAALAHLGKVPPPVEAQFNAARRAMVRSQEGLRETLWGLNHIENDTDDFAALLEHAVSTIEHWPHDAVHVSSLHPPLPLSRQTAGSLLMLTQEVVGNAFKHGSATRVDITLTYRPESFEMKIRDNGSGFNLHEAPGPRDGHFGLESAKLRMKWLKGSLAITSQPDNGTTVSCTIPASIAYHRPSASPRLQAVGSEPTH